MDVELLEAVVAIGTTIAGVLVTYLITNKKAIKFIKIAQRVLNIVGDAYNIGKSDAEIGREVRELCDELDGDEATPELQYQGKSE